MKYNWNINGESLPMQGSIAKHIGNGWEMQAVLCRKERSNGMKIEYRFKRGDTFFNLTKYQAKKHLTGSQIENIELFETLLKEDREMKSMAFGRQLDIVHDRRDRRKDDMRLHTALEAIEQCSYTEM